MMYCNNIDKSHFSLAHVMIVEYIQPNKKADTRYNLQVSAFTANAFDFAI